MKYTKYTYGQFINEIKERLEKRFGNDYKVIIEQALRNNSCMVYSFVIVEKVPDRYPCASPVINAEELYDGYRKGKSIDNIVDMIVNIYNSYIKTDCLDDVNNINSENAEKYIFYRLVNYEMNRELLDSIPHICFLDLAVTFYYLYSFGDEMIQSMRIDNELMKKWQYSLEQLKKIADKNTPVLFPDRIDAMRDIIESGTGRRLEDIMSEEEIERRMDMYVLTNDKSINGATVLLYSDRIRELAELYDSDIVILPSSIHEVILLPLKKREDAVLLQGLVENVNREHVAKEDVLSDNVYIYNRQSNEIEIIKL